MDSVPRRRPGIGGCAVGRTVEVYRYDVFGRTAIYDLSGQTAFYDDWVDLRLRPASVVGNPYFFTGRRLDVETGLYYYRARMYNPAIGRFLQTDPVGYTDGINWYAYCGNNPVMFVDPYGENAMGGFVSWIAGQGFDTSVDISTKAYVMDFTIPAIGGGIKEGGKGLAAGVDGAIPVYNPLSGVYANPDGSIDNAYLLSRLGGQITRDAVLTKCGYTATRHIYNAAVGSRTAFQSMSMGQQMATKALLPGAIARSAGPTAAASYTTASFGMKGISAYEYVQHYKQMKNAFFGDNVIAVGSNTNSNFQRTSSSSSWK